MKKRSVFACVITCAVPTVFLIFMEGYIGIPIKKLAVQSFFGFLSGCDCIFDMIKNTQLVSLLLEIDPRSPLPFISRHASHTAGVIRTKLIFILEELHAGAVHIV